LTASSGKRKAATWERGRRERKAKTRGWDGETLSTWRISGRLYLVHEEQSRQLGDLVGDDHNSHLIGRMLQQSYREMLAMFPPHFTIGNHVINCHLKLLQEFQASF